ncbi:MAG: Ribosomal large subunit pseudouridine synthase [Pseudomonadota bacterium]
MADHARAPCGQTPEGKRLNFSQVSHLLVDENGAEQRLDNFLFRHLKGVPKTHVYRIIRSGEVRLNKGRASADTKLTIGDVLRLPPVRVATPSLVPSLDTALIPTRNFQILFEDEAFIAIDKPAGLAVHGGSGVQFGVIEQLRQSRPNDRFLELVHRLDRETSGVLLIAKKRSALRHLQDQFRNRETGKTYLSLVKGAWPLRLKVIDQALRKYLLPDGERRVSVVDENHPDAMRSITLVQRLAHWQPCLHLQQGVSLLAVTIKTGRTHQIRVHLAHAGHVIAGDDKYGDFEWNRQLIKQGHKRMFLHAWKLKLLHPVTQISMVLEAEPSSELKAMLPEEFRTHFYDR